MYVCTVVLAGHTCVCGLKYIVNCEWMKSHGTQHYLYIYALHLTLHECK